jgi:hypothetical protein
VFYYDGDYDIRSDIDAVVANDSIEFTKEVIESVKLYLEKG